MDKREKELRLLATEAAAGNVFLDRFCRSIEEVRMVFMVLSLADEAMIEGLKKQLGTKGIIYEYMKEAGPRSINGLPMFMSMRVIPHEEAEDFTKYYHEELARRKELEGDDVTAKATSEPVSSDLGTGD